MVKIMDVVKLIRFCEDNYEADAVQIHSAHWHQLVKIIVINS